MEYRISATGPGAEVVSSITFSRPMPGSFSLTSGPEDGAACCECGSAEVVYRNYRDQPFCWPCANPPGRWPWRRRLAHAVKALRGDWP